MNFERYEYTIPEYYLSAIINDDYSGLSDEECEELNAFLESLPGDNGHWNWQTDESYFHHTNDVSNYACNVVDCVYMVPMSETDEELTFGHMLDTAYGMTLHFPPHESTFFVILYDDSGDYIAQRIHDKVSNTTRIVLCDEDHRS